jgi:hypothetical protein
MTEAVVFLKGFPSLQRGLVEGLVSKERRSLQNNSELAIYGRPSTCETYSSGNDKGLLTSLRVTFGCMCKRTCGIKRATVLVFPVHGPFVSSTIHNRLIAIE